MSRAFVKFQYGKEAIATHGTAVAATKMLLADPMPIKADRKPEFVEDAIGLRAASYRSRIDEYLWQDTLKISNGYFQALPAIFSCGLKGNITPTEVTGGQGDYLWTFTPSLAATNTPDSITLEMGDDIAAYEVEYLMFRRIKISGKVSQGGEAAAVAIEAEGFGRQSTTTTFTPALQLPTTENMNAKMARFYLDPTWANVGITEKTAILRGFDAEILTGLEAQFFGSGNKYFDIHSESIIAAMLTLDLEAGAVAEGFLAAMQAQSLAVARLAISGAIIGAGTAHSLKMDIGGRWEDVTPQSEYAKGNAVHKAILHGMYDPTGAKLCQVAVVTNLQVI